MGYVSMPNIIPFHHNTCMLDVTVAL